MSTISLADTIHDLRFVQSPLPSAQPSLIQRIKFFFCDVGELIQEWTPFLLVLGYFIFSTCLYMICSHEWMEAFWFMVSCPVPSKQVSSIAVAGIIFVKVCFLWRIPQKTQRSITSNEYALRLNLLELSLLSLIRANKAS